VAQTTNHWKLGLFVVVGMGLALATVFWLGLRRLNRDAIPIVTYFDESVQGLDVGSPVKFRGQLRGDRAQVLVGEAIPKLPNELEPLLWGQVGEVDSRTRHGTQSRGGARRRQDLAQSQPRVRPNVLRLSCKARLVILVLSYPPGRALAAPNAG